jgi:Flp pilus assembly protein TadD
MAAAGADAPARAAGDEKPTPPPGGAGASTTPPSRGVKEMVAEGEKLLAQGEVAEACRRGEDAKHSAGKVPAVYKFLGKCYMRAGNANLAKDNYRHYLELAPNAPDAMFIESIVKESAK